MCSNHVASSVTIPDAKAGIFYAVVSAVTNAGGWWVFGPSGAKWIQEPADKPAIGIDSNGHLTVSSSSTVTVRVICIM